MPLTHTADLFNSAANLSHQMLGRRASGLTTKGQNDSHCQTIL